mgnify:CR=1 FL=1
MGKWTRRAFLSSGFLIGGGVVVGVALRPGNIAHQINDLIANDGESLVHAFVKIGADNLVTAMTPHAEMGQGAQTAMTQMLADELDADWEMVRFEEAPAIPEYANYTLGRGYLLKELNLPDFVAPSIDGMMMKLSDALHMQVTGGSMSIRVTGQYGMRIAGAAAREMLIKAAAKEWDVPANEVTTENSYLFHVTTRREGRYADFAPAAAVMIPSSTPALKDPAAFKLMGQSKPRRDIPSKVDGSAIFAIDIRRPHMVYAAVKRSPVFGGQLLRIDDKAARIIQGVIDVIKLPADEANGMVGQYSVSDSVAVVAESYWIAEQGIGALELEWDTKGLESVSSNSIFKQFDRDISAVKGRHLDDTAGDIKQIFSGAAKVLEAEYQVPYLAHTCMEPMNATAEVTDSKAEIWVGCQNPLGFRHVVADALGIDADNVILHNCFMGGGFGRKSIADYATQAALIAKAVGQPTQLIWSREEDIRQDFYRPAVKSHFRAAIDKQGNLLGWENTFVDDKDGPIDASLIPYLVPARDIGHVRSPTHVPFGAWRSVDHSQHAFFTESFIDEVAITCKIDPYEFRAELLADKPRHLKVLRTAAEAAGWNRPLDEGRGRGISLHESFGSIVAQVVEVTVVKGKSSVDRVVAAIDAGYAISPDGISAQVESGIIYGLTAALHGEITIQNGAVSESNFHDYQAVRMSEAPIIETHIINSGKHIGGAGEPGTPGIAPALANAIYDATGARYRNLPLKLSGIS